MWCPPKEEEEAVLYYDQVTPLSCVMVGKCARSSSQEMIENKRDLLLLLISPLPHSCGRPLTIQQHPLGKKSGDRAWGVGCWLLLLLLRWWWRATKRRTSLCSHSQKSQRKEEGERFHTVVNRQVDWRWTKARGWIKGIVSFLNNLISKAPTPSASQLLRVLLLLLCYADVKMKQSRAECSISSTK